VAEGLIGALASKTTRRELKNAEDSDRRVKGLVVADGARSGAGNQELTSEAFIRFQVLQYGSKRAACDSSGHVIGASIVCF